MVVNRLYKTLPSCYVGNLLNGDILFRNLVYFKIIERDPRSDVHEGSHVDYPNHPVRVEVINKGQVFEERIAFHNSIKHPERIFCFCTSTHHAPGHSKFGNACVEIHEPSVFTDRLRIALRYRSRLTRLEIPVLLAQPVTYYRIDESAPEGVDIKDPRHLAFLKRDVYVDECEFRFVFAKRGGYELLEQLVLGGGAPTTTFKPERETIIRLGSIRDIARRMS